MDDGADAAREGAGRRATSRATSSRRSWSAGDKTIIIEPAQPQTVYVPSTTRPSSTERGGAPTYPPVLLAAAAVLRYPGSFVGGVIGFGVGLASARHWGWCQRELGRQQRQHQRQQQFRPNNNNRLPEQHPERQLAAQRDQRKGVAYRDSGTRDKYQKTDRARRRRGATIAATTARGGAGIAQAPAQARWTATAQAGARRSRGTARAPAATDRGGAGAPAARPRRRAGEPELVARRRRRQHERVQPGESRAGSVAAAVPVAAARRRQRCQQRTARSTRGQSRAQATSARTRRVEPVVDAVAAAAAARRRWRWWRRRTAVADGAHDQPHA